MSGSLFETQCICHSLHILKQVPLLPVEWCIKFIIAMLMLKVFETGQPPAVISICSYLSFVLFRIQTSSSSMHHLPFGSCWFHVSAPTLWNSLPRRISFCKQLFGNILKHTIGLLFWTPCILRWLTFGTSVYIVLACFSRPLYISCRVTFLCTIGLLFLPSLKIKGRI